MRTFVVDGTTFHMDSLVDKERYLRDGEPFLEDLADLVPRILDCRWKMASWWDLTMECGCAVGNYLTRHSTISGEVVLRYVHGMIRPFNIRTFGECETAIADALGISSSDAMQLFIPRVGRGGPDPSTKEATEARIRAYIANRREELNEEETASAEAQATEAEGSCQGSDEEASA